MREIKKIIVHCSASSWGSFKVIDEWHKERGWDGCGYHYIIPGGKPFTSKDTYREQWDGILETGRPIETQGAHCKGENHDSIGICLIGKAEGLFTPRQTRTLRLLLRSLSFSFNIEPNDVYGHHEFNAGKSCPGFDVRWI